MTAAILVEEGKLSLDDPVSKYLPEFKVLWVRESETNDTRTLRKAKNELTVRMCLNHTGGFPFEIPAKQAAVPGGGWSGAMPVRRPWNKAKAKVEDAFFTEVIDRKDEDAYTGRTE